MKRVKETGDTAEQIQYSRYYEHDGMLRAYANRSMVLALLFGVIAIGSLAFAVYIRLQPPTVIRVDAEGDATVVGGTPFSGHARGLTFLASSAEAGPSEVEAKAVVRRFLDHYLNYTPATVDKQMADALNLMTSNFRTLVLGRLRDDDTIYKIQDDRIISNFTHPQCRCGQRQPADVHGLWRQGDPQAEEPPGDHRSDRWPLQRASGL